MKYGIVGAFIKTAFAKTVFEYIAKEIGFVQSPDAK